MFRHVVCFAWNGSVTEEQVDYVRPLLRSRAAVQYEADD